MVVKKLMGGSGGTGALTGQQREVQFKAACTMITGNSQLTRRQKEKMLAELAQKFLEGTAPVGQGGILGTHTVQPGYVGIVHDRGRVRAKTHGPGTLVGVPGLTQVEQYSVRVQKYDFTLHVLSKRRLPVDIDLTVLHRIETEKVMLMFQMVGQEYDSKMIEPVLTYAARQIAYEKTEEELMHPGFATELNNVLEQEFEQFGLHITITIRNVKPANVVTEAYAAVAKAEYEQQTIAATMNVFALHAKLAMLEVALRYDVKMKEAEIEANTKSLLGQVEIDLEKQRRDPSFFSEAYFRDQIIKAGWSAMTADALSEAATILARGIATWLMR